jgi:hypothetical protein
VVHRLDHFALDHVLQQLQVEHHAGDRVGLAVQGHLQHVVVAVPVRVGTLAVQAPVLLF